MKRVQMLAALMPIGLALSTAVLLAQPGTRWVRVKHDMPHHERLVNRSGVVLGEYYQMEPGDFRAQCYDGAPAGFATEGRAREFVLACPVW